MKRAVVFLAVLGAAATLTGCVTRTEVEYYAVATRDTTFTDAVRNAPGERDNGVIYPSSREQFVHREYTVRDSVRVREYPAFLRLGLLEFAGLVGTTSSSDQFFPGLFGVYGLVDSDAGKPHRTHAFPGGMIRLVPYEARLRWFRDSPDWTWGTALWEMWAPKNPQSPLEPVMSIFPIYVRKRFFLHETPPYVMVQPAVGFGIFPWQYMNIGGTFDVGSYGGLNFRAYLGYVAGVRPQYYSTDTGRTSAFPYFGFGVSVLDFVNRVEETQVEWKDQKNHAVEISAVNLDLIHAFSSMRSALDTGASFVTGYWLRLATMSYPVWPVWDHLFVGTSLANLFVLGAGKGGIGVLPLRVGCHWVLVADELTDQAFAEFNYYPSGFVHLGDRLTLDLGRIGLNVALGFVTGSPGSAAVLTDTHVSFSGAYFSVGASLGDAIFGLDKLERWSW